MNKSFILLLDAIVVIVLLVIAVVYFTHSANHLPHWFPGYSTTETKVHVKHGLAAVIVALAAAAYGWFATGPKPASSGTPRGGSAPQ